MTDDQAAKWQREQHETEEWQNHPYDGYWEKDDLHWTWTKEVFVVDGIIRDNARVGASEKLDAMLRIGLFQGHDRHLELSLIEYGEEYPVIGRDGLERRVRHSREKWLRVIGRDDPEFSDAMILINDPDALWEEYGYHG